MRPHGFVPDTLLTIKNMDFFNQPKDLSVAQQEIEGLQKYLDRLNVEKDVLTEDMKGYETNGYERFKKVLAKEKVRIALVRMMVDTSETAQLDQLRGQFFEVEKLEHGKEDIERDVKIHERKISELVAKIDKLKKQLKKQTEK